MIKIDKSDSKKLQFLLAAINKDESRPILKCVDFNDAAVTTDGFRLHALNTEDLINEDLKSLKGTFDLGKVRAGENIIDPEPFDSGDYPEYQNILPKQNHGALIVLKPKFLVEFCKYLDKDKPVYIMLRGSDKPIELKGTLDDTDVYGIIMPMHWGESTDDYAEKWEPKK